MSTNSAPADCLHLPALPPRWPRLLGASAGAQVLVFLLLRAAGLGLEPAQALAFAAGIGGLVGVLGGLARRAPLAWPWGPALLLLALAYPLQAGVLAWAWGTLPAALASLPGALLGGLTILLGLQAWAAGWRCLAPLAVVYLLLLRLVYIGQLELVPQEAYYWNFSQHLDIGYLDHPPMVAWLIAAGVALGERMGVRPGGGEFFVRLPALLSWMIMSAYVWAYARAMKQAPAGQAAGGVCLPGQDVALRSLLLAATLPFFFGIGVFMTPDAPLAAAWAAALYYLRRALLDQQRHAWLGAGLALGLGMLAKYSMVLLAGATLLFVLLDARSRRLLLSPWLWGGALLALLVFAPVIVWNFRHDWASFIFQGSRRLGEHAAHSYLPTFLAGVLGLLTPLGVLALWGLLRPVGSAGGLWPRAPDSPAAPDGTFAARERLFLRVFTLLPLLVFGFASIRSESKFHWTGPIWLAVLPLLAASMAPADKGLARWLARAWPPLLAGLVLVYAYAIFYYPVWGLGGVRTHHNYLQMGWRDLRQQVQGLEEQVLRETGRRPAVVGLDKRNTADEMAFYDPRGDGALDTASRHLFFNESALMYEYWYQRANFAGRNLIAVSPTREEVEDPRLAEVATRLGPVLQLEPVKGGVRVGRYYARVVYGYRPPLPDKP